MTDDDLQGARLLLLLRARVPAARRRILGELRANDGQVRATAEALGVGYRSLYRAAERDPDFGERFRRLLQGRQGAMEVLLQARRKTKAKKAPAKRKKRA